MFKWNHQVNRAVWEYVLQCPAVKNFVTACLFRDLVYVMSALLPAACVWDRIYTFIPNGISITSEFIHRLAEEKRVKLLWVTKKNNCFNKLRSSKLECWLSVWFECSQLRKIEKKKKKMFLILCLLTNIFFLKKI